MTQIHQREIMKHDAIKLQTSHLVWSNCSRYGPASSEQRAPSVPLFWECAFQFITFHGWKKKKSHYILADSVWIYSTGPKTNSTNPSPTQFSTSVSSLNAFQCSSVNMFHSSHVYFFLHQVAKMTHDLRGEDKLYERWHAAVIAHLGSSWDWNKLP